MIFGFWILANDEKGKLSKIPKEAMDIMIPVGKKDNPLGMIKRSEIDDYLTPEFYKLYTLWENFHYGFGLPLAPLSWAMHPEWIIDTIKLFQREYDYMKRA